MSPAAGRGGATYERIATGTARRPWRPVGASTLASCVRGGASDGQSLSIYSTVYISTPVIRLSYGRNRSWTPTGLYKSIRDISLEASFAADARGSCCRHAKSTYIKAVPDRLQTRVSCSWGEKSTSGRPGQLRDASPLWGVAVAPVSKRTAHPCVCSASPTLYMHLRRHFLSSSHPDDFKTMKNQGIRKRS